MGAKLALKDNWKDKLVLFAVFLAFNAVLSAFLTTPVSYIDEYGVLAVANHIAGGPEWTVPLRAYYGFSHSIFYSVLFNIFNDIHAIYVGALCINSAFVALVPVFCYKILDEVALLEDVKIRRWLCVTVGLFPYFTLYSKLTRNETLLFVMMFIIAYLIGKNLVSSNKKWRAVNSVLLGVLPCFAYAAHGIGLVFIVAVCLVVALAWPLTKKHLVNYGWFIAALVGSYLLFDALKGYFLETVYNAAGGLPNTLENNISRVGDLFTREGFSVFAKLIGARLHYVASSTLGAFLLAGAAVVAALWAYLKKRFAKVKRTTLAPADGALPMAALFGLLLFLGALAVSSINNIDAVQKYNGTYFFYGRYYEGLCGVILLIGLCYLFQKGAFSDRAKKRVVIFSLAAYALLAAFAVYFLQDVVSGGTKKRYSVLGTLPFAGNDPALLAQGANNSLPEYNILLISAVAIAVTAAIGVAILKKRYRLSMGVLCGMFVFVTIFNMATTLAPFSRRWDNGVAQPYGAVKEQLDGEYAALYEEYPHLVVVKEKGVTPSAIAQLVLNDYGVEAWPQPEQITAGEWTEAPEDGIYAAVEDFALPPEYHEIYAGDNAYLWIRGDGIEQFWEEQYG